ncbi:hypothetical protein [Pontibacterium sp.]|uniref:hypothetical protein n=1 Tax=Pontibacterium sp. TaxID=2036026 RepID=UPI00355A14D4
MFSLLFSAHAWSDGGDFSQDFTASAPLTYNHTIGGGAFDDRTVGRGDDIVESLEGGDFACGDIVTFLTQVVVDDSPTDPVQVIELDYSFTAHSTGQQGTALADIVNAEVNYGVIDMGAGDGPGGTDAGINDDLGSVATLVSESLTGPVFVKGSELLGTVEVTDLEAGESVVVRVDVMIQCQLNSNPTGNMQGQLAAARVISPSADTISGGAQTIPFKKVGQIEQPQIDIIKTVTIAPGSCPGVNSEIINFDQTAKYCYEVINSAQTAPLLNLVVTDDNGTPGDTGDDFTVTLTSGLTDEDNDNQNDDLAAGSSAFGESLRPMTIDDIGDTIINTATADADDVDPVTDIAEVQVPIPTLNPSIDIKKEVSVDGGSTFFDANDAGSAPATLVGGGALYKLTVENTGDTALENVVINDADLGIVNYSVGNLAIGQIVVLTENEILALNVPGRCSGTGVVSNTATAAGNDVILQIPVNDSDDANVLCVTESIKVLKEISIDGGTTYEDANDAGSAPSVAIIGGALYRITITNTGTAALSNVIVNDTDLGIIDANVGSLASGASFVLTSGSFPVLNQPARCQAPGTLTNTATASATSDATGNPVQGSDDAVVNCVDEAIELIKEISVDGGNTYFDANQSNGAPAAALGEGALYRITLTNIGTATLMDVVVNDPSLGIVDFLVGNLAPGQTVELTSGEIPELDQPNRCQAPGDVVNIATVEAISSDTGNMLSDSDPAVLRCVEEAIDIVKLVSVDGGATYFDANTGGSAPVTALGGGALYRITLTNTGTAPLENVVVNDATLNIVDFFVGDLAVGQTVVLNQGEIPELDQPGLCQVPGDITNIATADGDSVDTGNMVSDSDNANVRCVREEIVLLKEVSVDDGITYFDANQSNGAPALELGGGALYRISLTNNGTVNIVNITVTDASLGIFDEPVSDLAPGQTVILTSGDIPALNQPGRCQTPGDVTNIAIVDGTSEDTGNPVSDSDPAVVRCVEEAIRLLKEVSVDGGNTYFDADDSNTAPSTGLGNGALYRITLTNIGTADLENVIINDATLNIVDFFVGNLVAGQTIVLDEGDIPALSQPDLCEVPGDVVNVATGDAISVETGNPVSDSDSAVVSCEAAAAGVLIIDEDSIDNNLLYWLSNVIPNQNNGIEFRKREVNEHKPAEGSRAPLPFFVNRVGQMFKLQTGQVGDEAWFAPETIPFSWDSFDAGGDGLRAFVDGNVPQSLLDEIPDVTPLRATGLVGLEGGTYCAIVYDSDVSINYGPLLGNLTGENLGIAAFRVEIDGVEKLNGFSSSSLPTVLITVLDPTSVCSGPLTTVDAPEPPSSSEPFDIDPENLSGGYL